jgi:hypothetical protein
MADGSSSLISFFDHVSMMNCLPINLTDIARTFSSLPLLPSSFQKIAISGKSTN